MWKHRPPNVFDFPNLHESFKYFNYQYILYGMGYETKVDPAAHVHGDLARPTSSGCARRACAPPPACPTTAPC
jgi:hypothetical protein